MVAVQASRGCALLIFVSQWCAEWAYKLLMKTLSLSTNHSHPSLGRSAVLLIPFLLACFAVSPQARAVCREGCDDNANTFLGDDTLTNNTTGDSNVAIGAGALFSNTQGSSNTAEGNVALYHNTTGVGNVALGHETLFFNTTGSINTAVVFFVLNNNTTGSGNTGTGDGALYGNTTGENNTANGLSALLRNETGQSNTAVGAGALEINFTGNFNTACGSDALGTTFGSNNIGLGQKAGFNLATGDNNIDVGNEGVADEAGVIRIGTEGTHTATYIAGIRETPLVHGAAASVGITADGQLGVRTSSARFKEAIKPMNNVSEAIFSLQPVTFRYKKDPAALPQFGLVAEEVAKVNPDLVARDKEGKPFTVRYDEINAMLLNEFLKEHKIVEEQGATIARLERQIEALTAGLQKVSAQVEVSKSAPQMVLNNR